jgi:RNA polymerase sigma-70 factor (ECF subfamily)
MGRPLLVQAPDDDRYTDGELLARAAAGDEQAFTALYRRRGAALYRYGLGMTGSRDAAEEVVQETFLALIEKPGGYDPSRGELASYLYGVARNRGLRRFRGAGETVAFEQDRHEGRAPAEALDRLEARERIEVLRRAVLALPESYREAVFLCDLEELSYAEAAAALGTAIGTVRSRLHRGRALLARRLGATTAKEEQAR